MAGLEFVGAGWPAPAVDGWLPCAGAVDSGSPWGRCLAMLLVRPRCHRAPWLLVRQQLFSVPRLLVLVVLLLRPGGPPSAYLLALVSLHCPMRIDADPERPAGLVTAWMVMKKTPQKLGALALSGVSASNTC